MGAHSTPQVARRVTRWAVWCALTAGTLGCRDATFDGGRRVGDLHVLAGRPTERGGGALTAGELSTRRFVSYDDDLGPLRQTLRAGLSGGLVIDELRGGDRVVGRVFGDGSTFPISSCRCASSWTRRRSTCAGVRRTAATTTSP
jgi:hypothetical protein